MTETELLRRCALACSDLVLHEFGSPADILLRHPSANSRLQERTRPSVPGHLRNQHRRQCCALGWAALRDLCLLLTGPLHSSSGITPDSSHRLSSGSLRHVCWVASMRSMSRTLRADSSERIDVVHRTRTVTSTTIWKYFAQRHRTVSILNFEKIASIIREPGSRLGLHELDRRRRFALMRRVAGDTALGAALVRSDLFRLRLAKCFDDSGVTDARAIAGPIAGAERFLALYTNSSISSVRRRRREYRSKLATS